MARVTVEDCVERVPNRFDLVLLAAQRSRDISNGAPLQVEKDNDKSPVVSLREIADDVVDRDELKEELIRGMQRYIDTDDPLEEDEEPMYQTQVIGGREVPSMPDPGPIPDAPMGPDDKPIVMPRFDDVVADD